jgi:pSer/pThr/pTyr-binding forkhead associated (FHA) protein
VETEFNKKPDRKDNDTREQAFLVLGGMIFPLEDEVFTIGRNLNNNLVLNDPTVSRFHAEIHYSDSQFLLIDKNSSSGTFLNNKRITQSTLFAGDIIQISHTPIMFMFKGASITQKSTKLTGQLKKSENNNESSEDNRSENE